MVRSRKSINQINVVPYIDVMLVLLIIFMVTAPLVSPGEIVLPQVGSALTTPSDPIEVIVGRTGSLMVRDVQAKVGLRAVKEEDLVARIRELQQGKPDRAVVIAADRDTRYDNVLKVLDRLKQSGVQRVGLLARPTGS